MSQKMIRFGLHDFLNAQPLLVPLLSRQKELGLEIVRDVPSALAEKLKAGTLDLAMIPTIEYLKEAARYRLVPGVCIASRDKVGTVLLVSQVPLEQIETLALDDRSRTSVALLKILFAKKFRKDVKFSPSSPDLASMLRVHDAALIIGDQAFSLPELPAETKVYDLSEEWFRETGKTFVHAVLAVREGVVLPEETFRKIQSARQEGRQAIADIANRYAADNGLDLNTCEDYLRHKIIYDLGEQELVGMRLFGDKCYERGMIPQKHEIRFIGN
ncbi:MAG: menaquinone biosynthesis protein [Nitrospinae bacterium]|nr:menaquinone biosynthesis protein [Nitrospinota bacterium]